MLFDGTESTCYYVFSLRGMVLKLMPIRFLYTSMFVPLIEQKIFLRMIKEPFPRIVTYAKTVAT